MIDQMICLLTVSFLQTKLHFLKLSMTTILHFFTIGNGGDKRLRKSKNIFSHRTLPLAASLRTLSLAASHKTLSLAASHRKLSVAASRRTLSVAASHKTLSLAASHRKLSLAASHRTLSLTASEYLYMVSMNAVAKDFL